MKLVTLTAIFVSLVVCPLQAQTSCAQWASGFNLPGLDGEVRAMLVHDDGSGPALFVAGDFQNAGTVASPGIAKWNGASWSALGSGLSAAPYTCCVTVSAMAEYNGDLYVAGGIPSAGGQLVHNIARWDGVNWYPVGGGMTGVNTTIDTLATFQGMLYAGGFISTAGGVNTGRIAAWDGTSWSAVGGGIPNGEVFALATFTPSGGQSALYVAGNFVPVNGTIPSGGLTANGFARWDGTSWSVFGSGLSNIASSSIHALIVHDDGTGPALFLGGKFTAVNGVAALNVAGFNGTIFRPLSTGITSTTTGVRAFGEFDEGAGPSLFAGGSFTSAGGTSANNIARWSGGAWSALGAGTSDQVDTLATFAGVLLAGGKFQTAGNMDVQRLARWDSSSWSAVSAGSGIEMMGHAQIVYDDGTGPALYTGGSVNDSATPSVLRWNGTAWSQVGSGITSGHVEAFAVHDDGSGRALYIGGSFAIVGVPGYESVARWNGTTWSALPNPSPASINALAVYDHGSGAMLYAGDDNGLVFEWNGLTWSLIGQGTISHCCLSVEALTVFDDGNGPALVATGDFDAMNGVSASNVAKWNGTSWSPLGLGVVGLGHCLLVHDDGTGQALYLGGDFNSAGGAPAASIARWDGSSWSALGAGVGGGVYALCTWNDGIGPLLGVGGLFTTAGGITVNHIARWNGSNWSALDGGLVPNQEPPAWVARGLASFDDGHAGGPSLFATGYFTGAGSSVAEHVARFDGCGSQGTLFCFGDGTATACPCGNASPVGANAGCLNSLGNGGVLRAHGLASVASDSWKLQGSSMPSSSCLYFQGTSQLIGGLGAVFGDGLRCAGGSVVRLGITTNGGGASTLPDVSHPNPISHSGGVAAGQSRSYQAWYRNSASFCTSAAFNLTNGLTVTWLP